MTDPISAERIAELRRLRAQSVPGDWQFGYVDTSGHGASTAPPGPVAVYVDGKSPRHILWRRTEFMHADDARLIEAAVNALPALLDEVESCRTILNRLGFPPAIPLKDAVFHLHLMLVRKAGVDLFTTGVDAASQPEGGAVTDEHCANLCRHMVATKQWGDPGSMPTVGGLRLATEQMERARAALMAALKGKA